MTGYLTGARVDQVILLTRLDALHEVFVNGNRYVEVAQVLTVFFGSDELLNVWVVNVQDAHIGAATGAALFHHVGGGIKGTDETDRTAGNATC